MLFTKVTLAILLLIWLIISAVTSYMLYLRDHAQEAATSWVFMGNLKETSISFWLRTTSDDSQHRLEIFDTNSTTNPIFIQNAMMGDQFVETVEVTGLKSSTGYSYKFLKDDQVVREGTFRTAPAVGDNFSFAASSCAWTGSNHDVYKNIIQKQNSPLFLLMVGDLHYEDLSTPSIEERIQAIDKTLGASNQQYLFQNLPMSYMWDDHDFLGNNLGGIDASPADLQAALEQYQLSIPHYPLISNTSMHHAYTISRVRFIISDLRSELGPDQIMSQQQEDWLLQEFSQSDRYDFVIWATSVPWIGPASGEREDAWYGYSEQRQRVSNFISSQAPRRNILAIAGDSHMLALDDGSNTYYGNNVGENLTASFPILQTGPLSRPGSFKGGPYSEGCFAKKFEVNHQYSIIDYDGGGGDGVSCLTIRAYEASSGDEDDLVFSKSFCGTDIYETTTPDSTGSCEESYFSTLIWILLVVTMALFVAGVVFVLFVRIFNKLLTRLLMAVVLILWTVVLYALGFGMPYLVANASAFDTLSIALIGLIAWLTVDVYLIAWLSTEGVYIDPPEREPKDEDSNDEKPEEDQTSPAPQAGNV